MATAESRNPSPRDWSARGALILGIVATFVLVGGFGVWSVTARIAGAIVASGTIEVEQNRQVVQHPDGGAVTEILVREGDLVTAGQVLARLDSDDLVSELTIIETHLIELRARRSRLEAERDGIDILAFPDDILEAIHRQPGLGDILTRNRELFDQRRETLRASIERLERRKRQIGNQIDGLVAQRTAALSQAALVAEEIETQQALVDRGLARVAPVLTLRREAARLEGALGEIRAAIALNEERITEIELESLTMEAQRREEAVALLSEQEGRDLELVERRRAIRAQLGRLEIRAHLAGVVLALQVFGPGSVIRPAQPVLHIVPENPPLVIAARIDPVHIGEVFVGQLASVRFSAFDTHRMPDLLGEVIAVSPDALTDERTGRDFYHARIALSDGEALKLPPGAALLPGMPADAYLQTGSRSPLAYLTRPVTAYFRKALRES
jgi:HlyD family secretion protein